MKYRSEDPKGWAISIGIHAGLLLILWVTKVPVEPVGPEFIELSWSAVSTPPSSPLRERLATVEGSPISNPYAPAKVRLPERLSLEPPDEIVRVEDTKKLHPAKGPKSERGFREIEGFGEKGWGFSSEGTAKLEAPVFAMKSKDIKPSFGAPVGEVSGRTVGFDVAWVGGGRRGLLSGKLPEYPTGVNVEAQIKIGAVVLPDGSIKSAHPIQKANTRLEEAALKEVRFWKFEPLASTHPQVEQTCTITFNFLLR